MKFRTKMLETLRDDAEAAADAIDEAQQQLNVLYESIRDAHDFGYCTVQELEQATGLAPATLQNVVDGVNPPIRPTIDLPLLVGQPALPPLLDK
jgi:hypothetical protein